MEMTLLVVAMVGIGTLYLFYRWGHKDGHKEGREEGYGEGFDSSNESDKEDFIEYAAISIFASRIQGLFTGKIKRAAVAKEAVLDAQALWSRMVYEGAKGSTLEEDEPTDDE